MAKLIQRGERLYGYVRYAPGRNGRKLESLGTANRKAAETILKQRQTEADKLMAGLVTADAQRLRRPLSELIEDYRKHLTVTCSSADHIDGHTRLVERLVEATGWGYFRQIEAGVLSDHFRQQMSKAERPWTAAYCNTFIKAIKAFVHWALPEGERDPLKRLRRFNIRNARATRAKRAANAAERTKLIAHWATLPSDRELSYTFALFNGLRRNEIVSLIWDDVALSAPVPFIKLKQKMGDGIDQIPLHPCVVKLLKARLEKSHPLPTVNIIRYVPDDKTMRKDVPRAGVEYKDAKGRILSLHALRHTFCTMLGETPGVTEAIRKGLMRHSGQSVTDGYTHVGLSAMAEALNKLAVADVQAQAVVLKTGTDDAPVSTPPAKPETGKGEVCVQICVHPTPVQAGLGRFEGLVDGEALLVFPTLGQSPDVKKRPVITGALRASILRHLSVGPASTTSRFQ